MHYALLDLLLDAWAREHDLYICKSYQDAEVRSMDIISPKGARFQIWIDVPSKTGDTVVHVWDMKKRKQEYPATKSSFKQMLEMAYQQAQSWF